MPLLRGVTFYFIAIIDEYVIVTGLVADESA
jgi:hypothetical protein